YHIPTLCLALPSARDYPLLKLLTDCSRPPSPPPPTPAPRKTRGQAPPRRPNEGDEETPEGTPCGPWTLTAEHCSLNLRVTTPQGTQVTVTVRL
ncbi:early protein E4, partial [Papio hamadryas papillomavirus 1]